MNPTGPPSAVKQERVTDVAVRPADRHTYSSSREYHVRFYFLFFRITQVIGWLTDVARSHLIVEIGTGTGTGTETGPSDRVANARVLRIALPGPGARTITTAVQGTATGNATVRVGAGAETDTPPAETGTLRGRGDVVAMAAVVVTGAVERGLLGKRPEVLEVARTSFLLLRGSALRHHR